MSPRRTLNQALAKTALFLGLPGALVFSGLLIAAGIYFRIKLPIQISPYDTYIIPSVLGALFLGVHIFSTLQAGKRNQTYIRKEYGLYRTSFLYSFFINKRLFFLSFIVFTGYLTWHTQAHFTENDLIQWGTGIGFILAALLVNTLLNSISTGLLTAYASRVLYIAAQADLSLMEYAL